MGNFYGVSTVAFSPAGGLLAVADNSKITLYQVAGSRRLTVVGTIPYPGTAVAFAATGRTLAAASYGGRFGLWNLDHPARPILLSTLEGRKGGEVSPVFSANGHYLSIPQNDGTTQVWDVGKPAHPVSFGTLDDATPLKFDPNGEVITVRREAGELTPSGMQRPGWAMSSVCCPLAVSVLTGLGGWWVWSVRLGGGGVGSVVGCQGGHVGRAVGAAQAGLVVVAGCGAQ